VTDANVSRVRGLVAPNFRQGLTRFICEGDSAGAPRGRAGSVCMPAPPMRGEREDRIHRLMLFAFH